MSCTARTRRRDTAFAAFAAVAATLALAVGSPAAARADDDARPAATERPARGMTMSQVESRYGAPASRHEAVGNPPITRWDYPGMIVYFEHDHVVHAVLTPAG